MVHNAALLVTVLAAASVAGEPTAGIKFPFHLPDSAKSKAQQDDAILQTRKRFDRHCFNFIFAVFEKHETMDEVDVSGRVLPLCRAGVDHDKCKKWSADLFAAHENKKRRHDKKGGALLAGPQSNGDWCAELYAVAAPAPVEDAPVEDKPAKPEVHAKSSVAPRALLRGQATHAEHVEHAHSEALHAEPPSRVERAHVEHDKRAAKVDHASPKATTHKEVPAKKAAVKSEIKKSVAASEHKYEKAVRRAAETPIKPKEVAHELPKIVYAKSTTAKPVPEKPASVVKPAADKIVAAVTPAAKKEPVASTTTLAPAVTKAAEIQPVSMKKPVEAKAVTAVKVEEKPAVPSTAPVAKLAVQKEHKKSAEEQECVSFRRDDGLHWSCPPGKTPPIPVNAQGTIIAAKAVAELPKNSESGLSSLWSAFNGAESAAKGLFSSLQMRW